jgi:hypothetical protein
MGITTAESAAEA